MERTAASRTSSRRFARPGVALLGLLFILAQALDVAHVATTRHEVCEEHGELVHVAGEALAPPAPEEDGGERWSALDRPQPAAHEHCGLVASGLKRATFCERLEPAVKAPRRAFLAPSAATSPRVAAIATILVAPKQSPPA